MKKGVNWLRVPMMLILLATLFVVGCSASDAEDIYTNNINPASNGIYDIGTNASVYRNGHFNSVYTTNIFTPNVEITGASSNFKGGQPTYSITSAPLYIGGHMYAMDFDTGVYDNAYVINDKSVNDIIPCKTATEPQLVSSANGVEGWGVVCFDVFAGGGYLTMYFKNSDFVGGTNPTPGVNDSDYCDTWLSNLAGGIPVASDYFRFSIWTPSGAGNSYTWANPDNKEICAGFTNPPHFTASVGVALSINASDGQVTAGANMSVGGDLVVVGQLQVRGAKQIIGSGVVPFLSDFCLQAFKAISDPSGNVAGILSGFQDGSNSDVNWQLWGIDSGMSLYGDCNYNWPAYAIAGMSRLDLNNHQINSLTLLDANLALSGGSHMDDRSNIGVLNLVNLHAERQGGSDQSHTSVAYGIHDSTNMDWLVDNWYGIYMQDHSAHANNSWGIYNQDQTYMAGTIVRRDGSIQPVNMSDASAVNDSVYYSTTSSKLVFKDPSGVVHELY